MKLWLVQNESQKEPMQWRSDKMLMAEKSQTELKWMNKYLFIVNLEGNIDAFVWQENIVVMNLLVNECGLNQLFDVEWFVDL